MSSRVGAWLRVAAGLGSHWVSLLGAALTTSAALTMLGFWLVEAVSARPLHPYAGIILFLVLPLLFVLGLVLIPVGFWLHRRREARTGARAGREAGPPFVLRVLGLVALMTAINLVLLTAASVKGVEYVDSTEFCGTACHEVMQPEHTAYLRTAHARVACAECHIGPGASAFVNAKLSGVRQLFAVTFDTYPRPIPAPVEDLRSADEICAGCHTPDAARAPKVFVRTAFAEDEANTPSRTVLTLKVGGRTPTGAQGIHGGHMSGRIKYWAADRTRQVIPRVSHVDERGQSVEYVSADAPQPGEGAHQRTMDCTDCHNRTGHRFELPHRALDAALADGRIDPALPWVKKEALALLRREYRDAHEARAAIDAGLTRFYQSRYAEIHRNRRDELHRAVRAVQDIYSSNVFPAMKVTWGTYPDHIGHTDYPGCFRCHDDTHTARDGRVLSQECEACHTIVAVEEPNPPILTELGITPPAQ